MDIYKMRPEEFAVMSLVIAIKITQEVNDVQQKYLIANFLSGIAQNISLMNAQILNLQNATKFSTRSTSEESDVDNINI